MIDNISIMIIVAVIFMLLFITVVLPTVIFYVRKYCGLHAWSYRNPYDRTCVKCGRNEVEHSYVGHSLYRSSGFWEVFKEGNGNNIICRKSKLPVDSEKE